MNTDTDFILSAGGEVTSLIYFRFQGLIQRLLTALLPKSEKRKIVKQAWAKALDLQGFSRCCPRLAQRYPQIGAGHRQGPEASGAGLIL